MSLLLLFNQPDGGPVLVPVTWVCTAPGVWVQPVATWVCTSPGVWVEASRPYVNVAGVWQ